jgi:pimeloyl-ACP methyl ester carboxylesterase
MGGTAAIVAAATLQPTPAAIVSLSAPRIFGELDAARTIGSLRVPALFVAARADGQAAEEAALMYRKTKVRGKRLLIVPGGSHGVSLLGSGPPRVRNVVAELIRKHG